MMCLDNHLLKKDRAWKKQELVDEDARTNLWRFPSLRYNFLRVHGDFLLSDTIASV